MNSSIFLQRIFTISGFGAAEKWRGVWGEPFLRFLTCAESLSLPPVGCLPSFPQQIRLHNQMTENTSHSQFTVPPRSQQRPPVNHHSPASNSDLKPDLFMLPPIDKP